MKKRLLLIICFLVLSCHKKEVLLSQIPKTIVSQVQDISPIYMFFETKENDTLVKVISDNIISSTNWLFNIDKRLPIRLIVPEIQKLQTKKYSSAHKKESTENYFTYMDSNKKMLAFMPFMNVEYFMVKPILGVTVYVNSKSEILVNDSIVAKETLQEYLNSMISDKPNKFQFCYSKNLTFEEYLKNRVFLKSLAFQLSILQTSNQEFVY